MREERKWRKRGRKMRVCRRLRRGKERRNNGTEKMEEGEIGEE